MNRMKAEILTLEQITDIIRSLPVKYHAEAAIQEATKFVAGARSLDTFDDFVNEMIGRGAV